MAGVVFTASIAAGMCRGTIWKKPWKFDKLPHVLLFSILAVMAGANFCRGIHSFVEVHLARLKETFGLAWRRAPEPYENHTESLQHPAT